ncbi:MAG: trehalase-like domain-containing protein [Betaproteobacteria bacterium]
MAASYKPIENYGMVGDMPTVAMIATDGSVDWMCLARFDSPSVFGALLDADKGGHFRIAAASADVTNKQFYWPETNVLVTRFLSPKGAAELTDFMPVGSAANGRAAGQLIRRLTAMRGDIEFRMACSPAFNYARDRHKTEISPDGACFCRPALRR